ncbi:MAG: GNAT family N-acetyltransferase [Chitinivibrionales bacterium]|nr:GNAT family N-acetyltransferase [Chitinivibrionales bacterium]
MCTGWSRSVEVLGTPNSKGGEMKVSTRPTRGDIAYVKQRIAAFGRRHGIPDEHTRTLGLVLKDESGAVMGGLLAHTMWRCLVIDTVWVDERFRQQGHGRELVTRAESRARAMGCRFAMTGTFESYGARGFYEKLGYCVVSTDRDSLEGQVGYWFHKELG